MSPLEAFRGATGGSGPPGHVVTADHSAAPVMQMLQRPFLALLCTTMFQTVALCSAPPPDDPDLRGEHRANQDAAGRGPRPVRGPGLRTHVSPAVCGPSGAPSSGVMRLSMGGPSVGRPVHPWSEVLGFRVLCVTHFHSGFVVDTGLNRF